MFTQILIKLNQEFLFLVKPREIRIITPLKNISTGDSAIELACQCSGSKPSARIRWRKGEEPIGALSETVSDDGLTTTSFITFVPSIDDDGKSVVCIGYNQKLSKAFSIQDTWPINIYCKCCMTQTPLCAHQTLIASPQIVNWANYCLPHRSATFITYHGIGFTFTGYHWRSERILWVQH